MSTKKPFWQEFLLQSIAPAMALMGVVISVKPEIIPTPNQCNKIVTASFDHTGNEKAFPNIQSTGSTEVPQEMISYEFSMAHLGILIAVLIMFIQIIRLYQNWKK